MVLTPSGSGSTGATDSAGGKHHAGIRGFFQQRQQRLGKYEGCVQIDLHHIHPAVRLCRLDRRAGAEYTGIVEQAVGVFCIARIDTNADIAGQVKAVVVDNNGLPDDIYKPLDNPGDLILIGQIGEQYGKFVTREARQAQS